LWFESLVTATSRLAAFVAFRSARSRFLALIRSVRALHTRPPRAASKQEATNDEPRRGQRSRGASYDHPMNHEERRPVTSPDPHGAVRRAQRTATTDEICRRPQLDVMARELPSVPFMYPDSSLASDDDGGPHSELDDEEPPELGSPTHVLQLMDALESRSYQRFVERLMRRSRSSAR